jgi:ribonuclease HI
MSRKKQDGAFGFVVRASDGGFVAAGAGKLGNIRSALQAEANACVAAIEAVVSLDIYRVIFESDCSTLVNAIKQGGHDLADTGVLFREARSLSRLHFDSADFVLFSVNVNVLK